MPDVPGTPRDRAARPSLDEVPGPRRDRNSYPVRECLLVVLNEEGEHRQFAERDLAVLESRAG